MRQVERHKQILQSKGPAQGKICGINHLVLFTNDLTKSIIFYRDILGLKIVRTLSFSPSAMAELEKDLRLAGTTVAGPDGETPVRQVFFDMGNGELFSLYEAPDVTDKPDAPLVPHLWPAANNKPPVHPQKLDHLAFNVRTREDLVWFQKHLRDNGVAVSEVIDRQAKHRFVISIYFSDPSGNPMEIATLDLDNPGWEGYDYSTWFRDEKPLDVLLK